LDDRERNWQETTKLVGELNARYGNSAKPAAVIVVYIGGVGSAALGWRRD